MQAKRVNENFGLAALAYSRGSLDKPRVWAVDARGAYPLTDSFCIGAGS